MCGFTFIINYKKENFKKQNKIFLDALKNRGDDSYGEYHDEDISFFFQRLSIIDHENGSQPMFDASQRYIICFSGEIYNYIELRKELVNLGSNFRTNSDTEIILEGFKKKGENILKDLNGMFSFVIWDKKKKTAFIARDRVGKKPIFWTKNQRFVCFSNSLNSFKIFGLIDKKNINTSSLYNFLIFNTDINENNFFFNNINKFPKAHYLNLKKESLEKVCFKKYWQIDFKKKQRKLDEFIEEYEYLLTDSIRLRLRSDTGKSLAISGGVDSSIIAHIITNKFQQPVNFVNIDHEIYRKDSDANDSPDKITDFLKQKVIKLKLSESEFINNLNKSLEITELPHNQYNNGLLYSLCENVGKNSKILLTGNGADEIFFGYNGDESHLLYSKLFFLPFKIMTNLNINIMKIYINYSKNRFQNQILLKKNPEENNFNTLENDFNNSNYEDLLDLKFYLSLFVKSENNNLTNPDIIGLKNNVEIRSPYLDHRIISFAASLPHKYKIKSMFSNYGNKFLPKEYANKVMPKGLIKKEKRGFGWNFNMNNLIHKKIFKCNYFDHFEDFNLNKNYFIKISEEFGKQLKNKIHPDTNISRFFYNSIMLSKWIKKL